MALVLDAGAFIALERRDESVRTVLEAAFRYRRDVRTSAAVLAQVWRGSGRQAPLATALRFVEVRPLDDDAARRVGVLLARSGTGDVVDAHVVTLCGPGDVVLTSDPDDLTRLADAHGGAVRIVAV